MWHNGNTQEAKSMTEGYAIIISAVISVGGMALTQFFNYLQRKDDIVDRFYFEFYQKRISVYDEAINELNRICEDGKIFEKIYSTNDVIYKRLLSDIHKLNILYSRLTLFGSSGAAEIIAPLCRAGMEIEIKLAKSKFVKPLKKKFFVFGILYRDFVMLIEETIIEFCRYTSRETAAEYIDEKTARILKKFLKKPWMIIQKHKK
jgi:hypothetical protein